MSNIQAIFPAQQALSIKETISTDLPQFIPHHEVILIGISDLFSSRLSAGGLSASDQSYLDSLSSSGESGDKAMASEIARWHHQLEYAAQCVADIENSALCKRMQLMLTNIGEERKQLKEDAAAPFERDDEYKFVLLDYNLQTFSGATSDANAIGTLLQKECDNMRNLLAGNQCSWRFHLIYAELLSRVCLDNAAVEAQIEIAQTKLKTDANSHYGYLALIGDIYLRTRQFDKARDALRKACDIMKNDGYCRTRLIYSHLYEADFKSANQVWMSCVSDLKKGGISDQVLAAYTNYIAMYQDLDDETNNGAIMNWSGDDTHSFIATPLKLFILAYKSGQYVGDNKFAICETDEFTSSSSWTEKNSDLAQGASHNERMVASFLKFCVEMFTNDDGESWDMQGPVLDNVFSSFPRPLLNDILDALCLENYLLGMFKLRWKGDCKNAFRFSIICNCRMNMNSYIGEVIGFQNAGNPETAVEKIEEIQKFVSVEALELFPIDAKRMKEDDDGSAMQEAMNELIALIRKNETNYDALLALADIYISQGNWQSAMILMQQAVEAATTECSKNLELRMKWGVVLYFNGYVPLAWQIFKDYINKPVEAAAHEYYCGLAASLFLELGKHKDCDNMETKDKLKGQNVWLFRFLCYKYWIEFFVKKKKGSTKKRKQPKTGKSQYDKAIDSAKKMIRLAEDHPLGHALLARSNIELLDSVDGMEQRIEDSVAKSVELADKLLQSKQILPQLYYESMIHCGVAMYQIGKDGSSYYNKACDNAPHGETKLCKLQREKITSKMDAQATRELLIQITKKQLNLDGYKKAAPVLEFNLDNVVALATKWDIFSPHAELPDTGLIGRNITKPEVDPNGGKKGAKPKAKKKKSKPVPDTDDDEKKQTTQPSMTSSSKNRMSVDIADANDGGGSGGGASGDGIAVESAFKYANLCGNAWPEAMLTYSLPFDDAIQMAEALTMLLRKEMTSAGLSPQDENDLIGRLHWGGEDALQFVLDQCEGKSDPLHLGLANFAYTYKVDFGLGSDEHLAVIEKLSSCVKSLSYEGKIGYAALRGLQCVTFEADDLFKQLSSAKDADGSDWLYHRHYGQYLLMIKHDYSGAVSALQAAYKANHKKDPITIGWYMAALSKSGSMRDHQTMAQIFDECGKYHETNTDAAVIREEFLAQFDIKTPAAYDGFVKASGATDFHKARQLICAAKYDRASIVKRGGISACVKEIKVSKANDKLFRILTSYFKTQAAWMFNNSLRQCVDGMTNAGTLCMDWALGTSMMTYCFAKKGEWDMAEGTIDGLPTKMYDPTILQCAGMVCNSMTDDIEMNKKVSPRMFIARIQNLRFTKAKDIDLALKELSGTYLASFKQDFAGLVALADILLSRGAIRCAYNVYFTIQSLYRARYQCNFLLRLKFAECMRLNGFQSEALSEFRATFACFDSEDKNFKDEMSAFTSVLIGFVLLNITIGDFEMAEKVLKVLNRKHILYQLADAYLTLLRDGAAKAQNVFNDCKSHEENPLMLAIAVQAGKMSGDDTSSVEAKLKALINGKYAAIVALKEYCEICVGISSPDSASCLTNAIAAAVANKPAIGSEIYAKLKSVFAANNCPSHSDIFGAIGACGVKAIQNEMAVTISANSTNAVQVAEISDDYAKLNADALKEIEAMKAGKVEQASTKSQSKSKSKSKSKKSKGSRASFKGSAPSAGPKPVVDYAATPLAERKKWAFQMAENLPAPKSRLVSTWSVDDIADFISKIPIFGLNSWYGNKFRESGVTGKMFLECNEQKLIKWGVDRKCHRARFRAEALAMKRRG